MKKYSFYFRFNDCPPFQFHKIILHGRNMEAAVHLFNYIFAAAGLTEDLEGGSYSVMGRPEFFDDFIVNGKDLDFLPFILTFGDSTIRKNENEN